ncbi:hypothetical protein AK812_SmicGene42964 [Symbiodinium microadriaticum]|uniref:Uncharacterized protein n=1 Tax=Symbiodinium microadriaticum TaxID=2951 RepID=A0A1Q9C289_SYMMI|nr:hypothetical protein AK812_SmicGene42964 [Symbiodinium microadriaticum]CAE7611196.1 unnamed protein product [Symbiodinium microadriaticum]
MYGHEVQGIAPKRFKVFIGLACPSNWGTQLARLMLFSHEAPDPQFTVVTRQAEAVIRCALAHGPEGRRLMLQAWRPLWQRQSQTRYGWQKVSGPVSALQYLQDLDVDGQDPLCWKWAGQTLELSTEDPCLQGKVRAVLAQVVAAWRAKRFSKAQSATGAEEGVDWSLARRLLRAGQLPKRRSSFQMGFQGLHLHEGPRSMLMAARDAPQTLRPEYSAEDRPAWGQFVYATDASGGRYTKDPRLRHAGWAVIAATRGPQGLTKVGTLSGVLMNSTVSAGESEAIISLLKLVDEEVDITTDSRVAMKHLHSANFTKTMYLSWDQVLNLRVTKSPGFIDCLH